MRCCTVASKAGGEQEAVTGASRARCVGSSVVYLWRGRVVDRFHIWVTSHTLK